MGFAKRAIHQSFVHFLKTRDKINLFTLIVGIKINENSVLSEQTRTKGKVNSGAKAIKVVSL